MNHKTKASSRTAQRTTELIEPIAIKNTEPMGSGTTEQIEVRRFEKALNDFCTKTRLLFEQRFPSFDYNADTWDFKGTKVVDGERITLQQLYNTKLTRISPALVVNDLNVLHPSFANAARAVLAHGALQRANKALVDIEEGLRLLKYTARPFNGEKSQMPTLGSLSLEDLRGVERSVLNRVRSQGLSAGVQRSYLLNLYFVIELLQSRGVVNRMHARLSSDINVELGGIQKQQKKDFKNRKAAELDPSIAALSDAIVEMVDDSPSLPPIYKAVLSVMGLEMCAPSRINEILTLSIKDRIISNSDYEDEPQGDENDTDLTASEEALKVRRHLHRAHAEMKNAADIVLTMKGSKGAAWGPKPILDFMADMFNECFGRLIEGGQRSRMLVLHYEQHPNELYLPPSLEHFRGKALNRWQIGQILLLDPEASEEVSDSASQRIFEELRKAEKPSSHERSSSVICTFNRTLNKNTKTILWDDVESELLKRVHKAMESIRWVTAKTRYEGRLSNMLMLHDDVNNTYSYLPSALNGKTIRRRLKITSNGKQAPTKTVFELLNITMPVRVFDANDSSDRPARYKEVTAYVSPHDPRRWLTTMALRHAGPKLSKLVVNMWARRKDISQVDNYDFRSEEEKAHQSASPMPEGMKELESFSTALAELSQQGSNLAQEFGLDTNLVTSGDRTVETTSTEAIWAAVENRPVARAGGKVIILYPTPFGVCLHQHHEVSCTAYNGCGTACNNQVFVKGDLPSNEATHEKAKELRCSVVAQIRPLILAHARRVAFDPAGLEAHIIALIKPHMSNEAIATRLIAEFHDYKHLIKDAVFRSKLEDAHVFQGVSQILNSPETASGALVKYDNPTRHASPEKERSIEAMGGREGIKQQIEGFNRTHPWFAPKQLSAEELARLTMGEADAANDDDLLGDDHDADAA